ncbi:MAG: hypothetical protein WCC17_21285, partial [Candidatus Nitrosopolaris sp.]
LSLTSSQPADYEQEKNYFLKKRILIVDDESDITTSFKFGLEQYGFRVSTYNDPDSCVFDSDLQNIRSKFVMN